MSAKRLCCWSPLSPGRHEYGVQIVTPNYEADPPEPTVVAKADWYAAPAKPDGDEG